jgi:hypothetical protein
LVVSPIACGGNGGSEGSEGNDPNTGSRQESDAASGDETGGGTGEGADPADIPALDLADMPPPGEAHVTVDGQTFVFERGDTSDRVFSCEVREDGVTINFQTDGHDLLIQGAGTTPADMRVNVIVSPEEGDLDYNSSNLNYGGVNFDDTHFLYVGEFQANKKGDPSSFSSVGQGTVSVSCP